MAHLRHVSLLAIPFALLAANFAVAPAFVGDLPAVPALPAVSAAVQPAIDNHEVAGAVTLVASPSAILHLDAAGRADLGSGRALRPNDIFWIASMTKPIAGTAVMMLADEGKLSIDDPVAKHLPAFGNLKLADGRPANVTIRHLLTHTSGLGEISPDEARQCKTLAEATERYLSRPVAFEPGSKWVYCQSGINTAARIVEVLSGAPFDQFCQERLFGPLGMKDTTFYLSEEQLPRLARSYRRTDDGRLEETTPYMLLGQTPTSRDRFPAANGGLFSTAPDYARFCQMILNQGQLDGRRYLSPEAVRTMTTPQAGNVQTGFTPGNTWGLAWCVVREPQGPSGALSSGSFGHGGAYGTQAWIDPERKLAYVLMVQRANFPNADASDLRRAFQDAAAAAVE
jgi:CubicO group peptidase (beta-lactamase class C family)